MYLGKKPRWLTQSSHSTIHSRDDHGDVPTSTATIVTIGVTSILSLSVVGLLMFLILKAKAEERKKKIFEEEERARQSIWLTGRAQLHSECVSSPGPHEMLDMPRPPEAASMGSEKVELPAPLPSELYGNERYIPMECDAGPVDISFSTRELRFPYTMQALACTK